MRLVFYLCLAFGAVTCVAAQDSNFAQGPQYLMNFGSSTFLHSIATPSMSLQGAPLEVGADMATADLVAGTENSTFNTQPQPAPQADLFPVYYGVPRVGVLEMSLQGYEGESLLEPRIPASILGSGTWQITTVEALRERGYGITLVEAAAYWKSHSRHAAKVYDNAAIERLPNK